MSSSSSSSISSDSKQQKQEDPKEKRRGNFDALLNMKVSEEDPFDDDGSDCGLCYFFKAGGCKKEVNPYSKCLKAAKTEEDFQKCHELEKDLANCMLTNPAYYAPLMQALHAMGQRNL